ncbi:MAG: hypothetical protein EA393_00710 [Bacteroidetes bacterium]|nr:MAG: hypothetical protein EA393_00710 [Bacteroidota bacterium]
MKIHQLLIPLLMVLFSCNSETAEGYAPEHSAYRIVKNIVYNDISVDVIIDKPENDEVDVLIVYHGTVWYDSEILQAAGNALEAFKRILDRDDMMIVSVAYPQENLLIGDNISHAEAALLWIKNKANQELDIKVKKTFLAGHSQGGYLVTRLNTMHPTNGVIANGPGPLNLVFRCQLEENGQIPGGFVCTLFYETYGSTASNPDAYFDRSLLNFTDGYKADILFVQGLEDSPIQMHSWPVFKQQVMDCTDCQGTYFLELPDFGHQALFHSPKAKQAFNDFVNSR